MYHAIASIYDQIQNIDYASWARYICRLDRHYNRRKKIGDGREGRPLLLDLGCGTGGFCLEMADLGYDPIGIDASEEMLSEASSKMQNRFPEAKEPPCLFLHQDISHFELYGSVDLAVCLLDTLNHLTRQNDVRRLFELCGHYLNGGGLMIFDLASFSYLSETLADNLFYIDQPQFTLFWQHHFSVVSGISEAELTLFQACPDGRYQRMDEKIRERYYAPDIIDKLTEGTGLKQIAQLGDLKFRPPHKEDQRTFYVYRKENSP